MIKMASGVAAKAVGPRGFMRAMMVVGVVGVLAAYWMSYAVIPLTVWLGLNGLFMFVFAIVCFVFWVEDDFDWDAVDCPLPVWAIMAEWSESDQPSWLRLIAWMLLIPAEIVAAFVLRPITLGVRALLNPMPGEWG